MSTNLMIIPEEVRQMIGDEKVDFSIKSKRAYKRKFSYFMLIFASVWSSLPVFAGYIVLKPLFLGQNVHIKEKKGAELVGNLSNMEPILVPVIMISFFLLVGIGMLAFGFYLLTKKGSTYVGTIDRLIRFQNNKIQSYKWDQFNGNIEINTKLGEITLELKSGKMIKSKNGNEQFIADNLFISGLENIFEIEQLINKRISTIS